MFSSTFRSAAKDVKVGKHFYRANFDFSFLFSVQQYLSVHEGCSSLFLMQRDLFGWITLFVYISLFVFCKKNYPLKSWLQVSERPLVRDRHGWLNW